MGKTSLLREFVKQCREVRWRARYVALDHRHWTEPRFASVIAAETRAEVEELSTVAHLIATLRGAAGRTAGILQRVQLTQTDINLAVGFAAEVQQRAADIRKGLQEAVDTALQKGYVGWLLILDDAHELADIEEEDNLPLSILLAAVIELQAMGVNIGLVLSGYPVLTANMWQTMGKSERGFRSIDVGPLSDEAAEEAFVTPLPPNVVRPEKPVIRAVVSAAEGYPWFIQVYGAELWRTAADQRRRSFSSRLLRDALPRIEAWIRADAYESRMAGLHQPEREVLLAAVMTYPLRQATVAEILKRDQQEVESSIGMLVDAGVIHDPLNRGEYQYTIPGFGRYLISEGARWAASTSDGAAPLPSPAR
jgi:hypothetical protein